MAFRNRIVRLSQLVADILQTGPDSARRWVIQSEPNGDTISGFTMVDGENEPAHLNVDNNGPDIGYMVVSGPTMTKTAVVGDPILVSPARLVLGSDRFDAPPHSFANLEGAQTRIGGQASTDEITIAGALLHLLGAPVDMDGGARIGGQGFSSLIRQLEFGAKAVTFDANGNGGIAHSLGAIPKVAFLTHLAGSTSTSPVIHLAPYTLNSGAIGVHARTEAGAAYTASLSSVYYLAIV